MIFINVYALGSVLQKYVNIDFVNIIDDPLAPFCRDCSVNLQSLTILFSILTTIPVDIFVYTVLTFQYMG